jgi:hypothetical protein
VGQTNQPCIKARRPIKPPKKFKIIPGKFMEKARKPLDSLLGVWRRGGVELIQNLGQSWGETDQKIVPGANFVAKNPWNQAVFNRAHDIRSFGFPLARSSICIK